MEKKEKIRRIVFWTSICVTVIMLIIMAIEIGKSIKAENDFAELRELVNSATTTTMGNIEPTCEPATTVDNPTTTSADSETSGNSAEEITTEEVTTTTVEETTTERPILEKYKVLHELNNHMVGWVKIENTKIDYPVLEVEGDNDYYLHKDFYGNESKPGQIIFDYRCDYAGPSTNIILHGHQMGDNTMFGSLVHYKKKYWFNSHPIIEFDTIYEEGEYEVFAAFLSKVYNSNDDVFKYYNFINADTEEEFNYYIENVKALALYDTGITPVFGDELLALSTCEYSQENGRLVVVARKIKKTESAKTEDTTTVPVEVESTAAAPAEAESTTVAPTEAESTAAAPTEVESTTVAPTEVESTTVAPTEAESTTVAPTEAESTTAAPTEAESTTIESTEVETTTDSAVIETQ